MTEAEWNECIDPVPTFIGRTNAEILNHCRQPGEHVRGCWVIDLLTGRK